MLDGFHPRARSLFFSRYRTVAHIIATLLVAGPLYYAFTLEPSEEEEVVKEDDPEIVDFAVEEEPEPEAEPEPEPPPPPPPKAKIKVVKNPKPRTQPKIQNPDEKPQEAADETDKEKVVEVGEGYDPKKAGQGTGPRKATSGGGKGDGKPKPAPKPEPKPKAKPKKKPIDPTKPVDRPVDATAPKPDPGNKTPEYPKSLRDEGITGRYVLKIHVHRDGSVRGAKILSKKNTATTEDEQKKADSLFLKAVIAVVKTWKFTPAKLEGQPISVWHTVTIPFKLGT